jgi:hypothetical protein
MKRLSAFISFLRQHRKGLVAIGALMVFLTFVFKEGLREDMKEKLTALSAARASFQRDMNEHQLFEVEDQASHPKELTEIRLASEAKKIDNPIALGNDFYALDDPHVQLLLNEATEIVSKIERNDLDAQRNQIGDLIIKRADAKEQDFYSKTQTRPEDVASYLDMTLNLWSLIDKYDEGVFKEIVKKEQSDEERLTLYTRLSYLFFTFGLIINVVGNFLEPEPKFEVTAG